MPRTALTHARRTPSRTMPCFRRRPGSQSDPSGTFPPKSAPRPRAPRPTRAGAPRGAPCAPRVHQGPTRVTHKSQRSGRPMTAFVTHSCLPPARCICTSPAACQPTHLSALWQSSADCRSGARGNAAAAAAGAARVTLAASAPLRFVEAATPLCTRTDSGSPTQAPAARPGCNVVNAR